eukprot:PhF_6_TR36519/c0_g1_i1/m.53800
MSVSLVCTTGDERGNLKSWDLSSNVVLEMNALNDVPGDGIISMHYFGDNTSPFVLHKSATIRKGKDVVMTGAASEDTPIDFFITESGASIVVTSGGSILTPHSAKKCLPDPIEAVTFGEGGVVYAAGKLNNITGYCPVADSITWTADRTKPVHVTAVTMNKYHPHQLVTSVAAKKVFVYDVRAGNKETNEIPLATMNGRPSRMISLSENTVLVGDMYGDVGILDLRKSDRTALLGLMRGGKGGVTGIHVVPNSSYTFVTYRDRFLRLFQERTLISEICTKNPATCVVASPNADSKQIDQLIQRKRLTAGLSTTTTSPTPAVYKDVTQGTLAHLWERMDVISGHDISIPGAHLAAQKQKRGSVGGDTTTSSPRRSSTGMYLRKSRRMWYYPR